MRPLILLALLAVPLLAAEVRVDAPIDPESGTPTVRTKVGVMVTIHAKSDSTKTIRWMCLAPKTQMVPSETGRWANFASRKADTYRLGLYSDAGGPPSYVDVVVEDETPPAPVPPRPVDPPSPVDPPTPTPVPTGPLRVLVLYESEDLPRIKPGHLDALYSRKVRDALNDACASDGPVKAWRIWDKDTDASASSREWQAALARAKRPARTRSATVTVPKVVAFRAEQFAGEWPLPDGEAGMLALIASIKGGK